MEVDPKIEPLKVATRGDVAAAALGYVAGFAIDNYFFPGGLTGGVIAALGATASVGLKNFVHAIWNGIRKPSSPEWDGESQDLRAQAEMVLNYIQKLVDRSDSPKEHPLRKPLEEYERMFTYWTNGLISDQEFYVKYFLPARGVFKEHLDKTPYIWVGK